MCLNLIKAGYHLVVFDLNESSVATVVSAGAESAPSPKAVAEQVEIIISIVPDTPHVEEVCFGPQGLIHGLRAGQLFIDMSTINASTEQKISDAFQAKGCLTLDAPVSGGEPGAQQGTLSIMVGGSEEAYQQAVPLFEVLGSKVSLIGGPGAGQITKSCNQIATALATQGVIEALSLAKKAGVDPHKVREAMLGGFAQSKALEISGKKMIDRDFAPGFMVKLYRKDLGIGQQVGRELAVPLPGASLVATEMDHLIAKGQAEQDFSALITLFDA